MKKTVSLSWVSKTLALAFLLTLTGMASLFSLDNFLLDPPKLDTSNPLAAQLQPQIDRLFEEQKARILKEIEGINDNPQKMIGAFATSSVFSSTGASLRTFQGYDTFALTVGAMAGAQLPISLGSLFNDEYIGDKLFDTMNTDGDLRIGMNPQILNIQLGINASSFLLNGLYVGLKGGFMSLPLVNLYELQMRFQTWSFGGMVNYQLTPPKRVLGKIFDWRGLNIGTGFIYQGTRFIMDIPILDSSSSGLFYIGNTGAVLDLGNPKLSFRFSVDTFTIPLEAVTSIRFLSFINSSLGAGVDLGFGSASMKGGIDAEINVRNLPNQMRQNSPGRIYVSMGGSNSPVFANPKLMASFGFSVGSVILLDIPVTWYFLSNGYNIGISFGVVM